MPDIKVIKIKLRRGTDVQRKLVTLDQGELGYTTDFKRVFVGDGVTLGGNLVGSKVHSILDTVSKTSLPAYQNDIVYETNRLYQLSGTEAGTSTDWAFVGTRVDGTTLTYDGSNILKVNTISGSNFSPNAVYASGAINVNSSGLSANIDNSSIKIVSNKLTLSAVPAVNITGTILPSQISSTIASSAVGLNADNALYVKVDGSSIVYDPATDKIEVGEISETSLPDTPFVNVNRISSSIAGLGLYGGDGAALEVRLEGNCFTFGGIGGDYIVLQTMFDPVPVGTYLPTMTVDLYGRVIALSSSIVEPLSGRASTTFNGYYSTSAGTTTHTASGVTTGLVTLRSGGFIIIDLGSDIGQKAIPIFNIS